MATKRRIVPKAISKTAKNQRKPFTGDPIIINGGGGKKKIAGAAADDKVGITFDHNEFGPDENDSNQWINRNAVLTHINAEETNTTDPNLDLDSTDALTIECAKGAVVRNIEVTGYPLFAIRFDRKTYPYRNAKHSGKGFRIGKIFLTKANQSPQAIFESKGGECKITIDFS